MTIKPAQFEYKASMTWSSKNGFVFIWYVMYCHTSVLDHTNADIYDDSHEHMVLNTLGTNHPIAANTFVAFFAHVVGSGTSVLKVTWTMLTAMSTTTSGFTHRHLLQEEEFYILPITLTSRRYGCPRKCLEFSKCNLVRQSDGLYQKEHIYRNRTTYSFTLHHLISLKQSFTSIK